MKICFLILCFYFSNSLYAKNCIERRAGIDVGSGSLKMKVYDVDICKKRLKEVKKELSFECSKNTEIGFKKDLLDDNLISEPLVNKGIKTLKEYKEIAIKCGANAIQAVATSAFRQALNKKAVIAKMIKESSVKISVIDQEDEALLGFYGAINKYKIHRKNLCVWDIGGSSMQITCREKGKLYFYKGHIASVPFMKMVMKRQKRLNAKSPNPVKKADVNFAQEKIKSYVATSMNPKTEELIKKSKLVLGIGGVHYYALSKNLKLKEYSSKVIDQKLKKLLNRTDEQLGGGSYIETKVTNVILVNSFMKALGIKKVIPLAVNLAEGLVSSESYWKNKKALK